VDVASLRVMFTAAGDGSVTRAIDGVNRKLDTVDGHARRAGGALDSMFKVAGGVLLAQGITKIGQLAGGILSAHSNAEQLGVSLEVATGSAEKAGKIYGELQKMAAATPFSFSELTASAVMIESFGQDSIAVMDTIGDTAAATGKSVSTVTQAYLDAGMGQFIRLQELGIDAATVGDKVVLKWVKNGKTLTKEIDKNNNQMIQSTVEAIWNDRYQGAMEKQSRTFAGQWSTLKDNANLAMMAATEGVFSSLTEILDFANEVFSDGLSDALRNIAGPLSGFGDSVAAVMEAFGSGRGVGAILAELPDSFQAVVGPILNVADALGDMWAAFQSGGLGGLADVLIEELSNIAAETFNVVIDTTVTVIGEVRDLIDKGWQWFVGYSGAAGGGPDGTNATGSMQPFTTVDVIVEGLIKLAGDLDDIGAAIAEELGIARTDADMTAAREEGRLLGQDIWNAFAGGITSGVGGEGGGDPAGKAAKLNTIAERIVQMTNPFMQIKAIYEGDTIFAEWMNLGIGIGQGMLDALIEGLSSAFNGTETMASRLNPFSEGAVMQGGVAGWLNDMGDMFTDVPTPELPGWLTDFGWITGPVGTLISVIEGLIEDIKSAWAELAFWQSADMGSPSNGPLTAAGHGGTQLDPNDIGKSGEQFRPAVQKVSFEADTTRFDVGAQGVIDKAAEITAAQYVATLDGDSGPFAVKYTEASGWGDVFASQTWTATFDADNGPAAVAYSEAFGWGNVWASQVFTARFSIDTSGLAAAEQAALATAQRIRDILPSSPAKKGPFAGPVPSLNYIADSFKASFSRMEADAERGMANVRSAMGAGGHGGPGGGADRMTINHPTYHIYPETGDLHREITAHAVGDWR
jgi:hypothetical protein